MQTPSGRAFKRSIRAAALINARAFFFSVRTELIARSREALAAGPRDVIPNDIYTFDFSFCSGGRGNCASSPLEFLRRTLRARKRVPSGRESENSHDARKIRTADDEIIIWRATGWLGMAIVLCADENYTLQNPLYQIAGRAGGFSASSPSQASPVRLPPVLFTVRTFASDTRPQASSFGQRRDASREIHDAMRQDARLSLSSLVKLWILRFSMSLLKYPCEIFIILRAE